MDIVCPSIVSESVSVKGRRVYFLTGGSGPPLVLIHGLIAYSFSWRLVLPALAKHFRVYALDMPGSGFSEPPQDMRCGLPSNAALLLDFLDALNIPYCDLMGTSYGGAVAMATASIAPERIKRLVLAAPVNPWSAHGRVFAPLLSNFVVAPLFRRIYPRSRRIQQYFLNRLFGRSERVPDDSLEGYSTALRDLQIHCALKTVHSWNRDLRYLEERLPRIRHIPTLVIWGDRDRAVSPASGRKLAKHFDRCRLLTFEGVGHLPYEEDPQRFVRVALEFFANSGDITVASGTSLRAL